MGALIDTSINLGHILTIASFIIGGVAFVVTMKGDNKNLATIVELRLAGVDRQVSAIEGEVKKLGEVMLTVAKQDGRLNVIDTRLQQQGERLDELTKRYNVRNDRA